MKNIPGSKPLPFGLPFLFAVHFLVGVTSAVGAQTTANQVRTYSGFIDEKTESITVVTDQFYPPYSFIGESGSLEGISIDLWKEWEKVTGIHVDLRGMNWASAIQHVTEGKADVIDTFFVTDERKKTVFVYRYLRRNRCSGVSAPFDLRNYVFERFDGFYNSR